MVSVSWQFMRRCYGVNPGRSRANRPTRGNHYQPSDWQRLGMRGKSLGQFFRPRSRRSERHVSPIASRPDPMHCRFYQIILVLSCGHGHRFVSPAMRCGNIVCSESNRSPTPLLAGVAGRDGGTKPTRMLFTASRWQRGRATGCRADKLVAKR